MLGKTHVDVHVMFRGFPAGTDWDFSPALNNRGRGGSAEERSWCFAQVKGPTEVNTAEGKKGLFSLSLSNSFNI